MNDPLKAMTAEEMDALSKRLIPHTGTISLLNYFAAREPTSPPLAFMKQQFPPNPLQAKNGKPLPSSDPTPQELAAALAKWRFMVAGEMVKESEKRAG